MALRRRLCSSTFAFCFLIVPLWLACSRTNTPPRAYLAFVANQGSNSIAAVDLARFRVVATIPVAPSPRQVLRRPRSVELYALSTQGTISVIAFPALRVVKTLRLGRNARRLLFTPDGERAFVLEPAPGGIAF